MAVKLVPQVERLLVAYYVDDHSLRETAERFGVHVETARRLATAAGVIRPWGNPAPIIPYQARRR